MKRKVTALARKADELVSWVFMYPTDNKLERLNQLALHNPINLLLEVVTECDQFLQDARA